MLLATDHLPSCIKNVLQDTTADQLWKTITQSCLKMLSVIRPDEPVEIRLVNQPQEDKDVSNEVNKDLETFGEELKKMGTKFDQAWKNKIDDDKQVLTLLEERMLEHQMYTQKMSKL